MRLLSKLCSLAFFLSSTFAAFSQVAIGTGATAPSPDTNAVLLLEGNGSQGIIIPKVSSLGTFGKPGMIVYNTATGTVHYFNTTWVQVGSGGAGSQGIQIVGNKVLIGTGAGFSTEFSIANTAPTIQGQILMWDTSLNSGAGGWTSSANTAPSTIGQVLKWNGSRWEPGTDNTGAVATLSGDVSGATTSTTISTTAGNSIATALNNGATTSRILESRITPSGTNNQVLTTVGGVTQWANPTGGALPSLSANQLLSNNGANTAITVAGDVGLSVTGTTGTFTIANNAITDAKVATGISANKITSGTLPLAQVPNLDAAKITTGTLPTARLDVGTTSNKIVQLDGAGKLPAIDGSQLTNLPAGSETDPTVKAINGLVKSNGTIISAATAGTDYLTPTGNGSGLTNLNAGNISSGTLAIANGGTGATTAPLARAALGLGTLATLSSVTTTEITDGTITDVDVSGTAAIAGSKIVPAFGAQNITTTTGSGSIGGGLNVGLANQFSINNAGNITKINGATTSFPAANAAGVLTNDGTGTLTWASGSGWGLTGNAGTLPAINFIGTTDAQDLVFRTNNTEFARLTSAGKLGIGTNAPNGFLDVQNAGASGNAAIFNVSNASNNGAAVFANKNGTTGAAFQALVAGGAEGLNINQNGTGFALDVIVTNASSANSAIIGSHNGTGEVIKANAQGTGSAATLSVTNPASPATALSVTTVGTGPAATFTGGNVGIGTATPGAKLDIAGNIKIVDGTQGAGKILTSDASGLASWQPATGGGNMFTANNLSDLTNFATARTNLGLGSVAYTWPAANATGVLTNNGSGTLTWSPGGAGSVTTVSVTPANGFTGSVVTASSTPAITIGTSLTGVLKGNGTALSVATGADLPVMTATVGGAVPTPPNNTTTFLRGDGIFATPAGGGTVTTASVVSANGFNGTVATSTSTPAITIGTSLTGLLKGNGTGLAVATAGTDFVATETDPTVKAINGLVKSNGTTISAATAGTDYLTPIGNGSGLTNLNATNISTGTLPTARLDVGTGANQLVQLDATGKLPAVDGSQLTGLAGGGDITGVTAGTGLTGGAASGNATLNVDVGTTANKIVQLDATGKLPAIDGSQLTGLAGGGDITGVTAGTGLTGGAASGNATLNVDVGTTANKIVQLDATGKLPVIDGSQLTNLPAGAETDPTVKAINGLVKSNGTTVSAATAGTDYLTPTGSAAGLTGITAAQIPNLDAAKITTGTLSTARLDVGTTANKIVQLDATGKLPVIDGSQLTNLPAGAETDPTVKAINGLVKSNGTTISAATAGTDYLTPIGNGSGLTNLNATNISTGTLPTARLDVGTGANQLVQLDATGKLPAVDGSQLTGLAGGGDITGVTAGTGLTGGAASGNATLNVDVGTTANKIVQLDATGKLPAVDGSQLTGLAGGGDITGVTAGTGLTGGAASGNATLNVDVGTTANKIVQLDATGKLPVIDGSQLTNLPAGAETDPTVKAINGLVKSNGTTVSAATAGTDYLTPTGSAAGLTGITAAQIPNLDAAKITTGTLSTARLDVGTTANKIVQLDATGKLPVIDGSQLTNLPAGAETDPTVKAINGLVKSNGTTVSAATAGTDYLTPTGSAAGLTGLLAAQIPALDASKITTGSFTVAQIPNLDASKITTGALPIANGGTGATTAPLARTALGLGTLSTLSSVTSAEITDGTIANIDIANVDAAKITTGTLSTARIDVGTTANKIVQLDATGKLPAVDGSLLTNLAGGGDITGVTAGTGLTGGAASGNATLNVDVGTTANKIVQLDATGKLPAVDGSLLTNLAGGGDITGVTAGTGLTGGAASGNATLNVDVGTTANKIVQLDATGKLPVIDGSQLTNLPAGVETDPTVKAINGLVKSNGTTISAATAGTDYLTPTGSAAGLTGLLPSQIPSLDASKITTGSFPAAQIPNLDASKITTGTLPIANGGTGATTAPLARTALGLGTLSTLSAVTTTEITDGTIANVDIANVDAAKITTGTLSTARIDVGTTANKIVQLDATGKLPAVDGSLLTNLPAGVETDPTVKAINGLIKSNGTTISAATAGTDYLTPTGNAAGLTGLLPAQIPSLDASKITTGSFPVAQIPNLDASKITTGTLPIANGGTGATTAPLARTALGLGTLSTLSAVTTTEITDGTIANVDIANVDAAKITTGTLSTARIDVGTTANKIVQLDATGKLPAVDGSLLTNLPAGVETDPTVKAITGLVKSNGTTISAATAGTDYLTPTGSAAGLTAFPTFNQNTTGNAATATTLATGRTIALTGDVTYTSPAFNGSGNVTAAATVTRINGTSLAGLATGILKNTTATGIPSIATGADLPVMTATVGGAVPTPPNNTTTFLRGDGTFAVPAGGGTVTTVSIASANGFNGTVATPTTTPALTIGTSLTGILKGNGTGIAVATAGTDYLVTETDPAVKAITGLVKSNGTTISAATAGTDYLTPTGSAAGLTGLLPAQIPSLDASKITSGTLPVANGGTGLATFGTGGILYSTGTTNLGTVGNGTAGQMLLITGTTPTWQTMGGDATMTGTGTVTIANNAITDAKVAAAAAIAGTKIAPNFGAQNVVTTGTLTTGTAGAFAVNATGNITKINNVTTSFPAANAAGVLTNNGTGTLTWAAASSGWGLTGNAGTVDGTNFIGTTDNIPFSIRVNNQKAGRIDHLLFNSFFGYQAGNSTTGANNVALGYNALQTNTTGQGNAAIGATTLVANSTGNANTAVGYNALNLTTASFNTAIGNVALQANTLGFNNTAAGYQSLILNSTASGNTAFGSTTLNLNTTGANNTALGFSALGTNATGSNNTAVGALANVSTGALTNATAIGANSSVTTSNTIQLGDAAVTTVNVGTGTTAKLVAGQLQITGGTLGAGRVLTSDASGNATWQPGGGGGLISNTGTNNLFAGSSVSTAGNDNAIFGANAGATNTGLYNVIIGANAATSKTSGDLNTIIGWYAGKLASNAGNTLVGAQAGENLTGGPNTFIGEKAGRNTTTGTLNVYIGNSAATTNTTGDKSTIIGYGANVGSPSLGNANAIGYLSYVTTGNSMVLGSINGVNGATADTNVGIGTTAPTSRLQVNGDQVILNSTGSYGFQQNYLSKSIATYIDANGGWLGTRTNDNLNFFTNNGLPQMTIIPSGNVGIGTTNPNGFSGRMLHLSGTGNTAYILEKTDATARKWAMVTGGGGEFIIQDRTASINAFFMEPGVTTSQLYLKSGGNVGIGTNNPQFITDISGTGGPRVRVISNDGFYAGYLSQNSSRQYFAGVQGTFEAADLTNSGYHIFDNTAGQQRMVIDYFGNMGIGFTNPSGYKLAVNGPALSSAWNTFSDARFKKNIQTLESSLTKIMALNGVSYDWKKESFPDRNFADGKQLGFIAQEVLNVIPELVTKDSEGYYSVNYVEAIPVLVEAMKEQQKMIDSLKAQDVESKKKIAVLEASLNKVAAGETELNNLKSEIEKIKAALGLSVEATVKKTEEKTEVRKEK